MNKSSQSPAAALATPNVVDKLVGYFSPQTALRRVHARSMMALYGSYVGARFGRPSMREWVTSRGSADADTLLDLTALRSRSRDLVRNAPIATGAINNVVQNAVGTGLSLQPTPDAEALGWEQDKAIAWSTKVKREFEMWANSKDCDATRTQDFYGLQGLALRSTAESGDTFALLPFIKRTSPYQLAVQLIEADRVGSPLGALDGGKLADSPYPCWAGVEVDTAGAPVNYIVWHKHPGAADWTLDSGWDRIPAFGQKTGRRNVIHLFDRTRPEQKRGVPYLAPVIEPLKQLDRYSEAEIMRAVVSSLFTVFLTTPLGDTGLAGLAGASTNREFDTTKVTLGSGKIVELPEGEEVQFADPKAPNVNFDPFFISIVRQIGVALEQPFEVLIKHFTASYSAARAALQEAWKFFKNRRNFIAGNFCQPVYSAWMEEAVSIGRIAAPGFFADPAMRMAYLSAEWIGDAPLSLDPEKDANAAEKLIGLGISSIEAETMALTGKNWRTIHAQRVMEHKMRVEADLEPSILATVTAARATEPLPDTQNGQKPNTPANNSSQQNQPDQPDKTDQPDQPEKN